MRGKKKKRRKIKQLTVDICIVALALCYLWFFTIYTTQQATDKNTYICKEPIISAQVYNPPGPYSGDEIHLKTNDSCYIIVNLPHDDDRIQNLVDSICSESQPLTMTVWKHFTSGPFNEVGGEFQVCQPVYEVVDLRTQTEVYWNLEEHNREQKEARIGIVIMLIPITLFFGLLMFPFEEIETYKKKIRKYKKKQKKAKQAGTKKGI